MWPDRGRDASGRIHRSGLKLPWRMPDSISLDLEPMLAAVQPQLPTGDDWEYEPKWDGFRTIAHRSGDSVELVSRGARPMSRFFPEVLDAFRHLPAERVVLDGELVIVG